MPYFTTLTSKADHTSLVLPATGKIILVAFWAGDATSEALIAALKKALPKKEFAAHG
jgi:hypothetical protein